ncbi:MAG: hypothetical protein V1816_15560 [Pseudomonadota bacterium]
MKKIGLCLGLLLVVTVGLSCADRGSRPDPMPRCTNMDIPSEDYEAVEIYQRTQPDSCVAVLFPFDAMGWFESKNMSRQLRDETFVRLGCVNCPAGVDNRGSAEFCGGCNTVSFNFDLARIPEDVELVSAQLAVFALENKDMLTFSVLEGRFGVGSDMTVIADHPLLVGAWALYDVTKFACRGVVEKRNSVSLHLGLPCGPEPRTKIALSTLNRNWAPALIVEYR